MVKWFIIAIGLVGTLALINAWVPSAWTAGFTIPIGNGISVSWALCILGAFVFLAAGLKSK